MLIRAFILVSLLSLSGCMSFTDGEEIKDFTNRSTVYGWLNVDDVDGNHLYDVVIKQFKPASKEPYYHVSIEKLKGGFLIYSNALPAGSFKLDNISLQSCMLFLCGNTYYTYNFGSQGDVASTIINKPATYYIGSLKLKDENTGWFSPTKFSVTKATNGPTEKEMLEFILKDAPGEHPAISERINKKLRLL